MFDIKDIIVKLFKPKTVSCAQNEKVVMDDPAYAQLDPHLKFDESEDQKEDDMEGMPPTRFKRKPPSMEGLMNNVKSVTKKVEHVKGFKFEIAPALSNNFHVSSSWNIPNHSGSKDGQGAQQQQQMMNPQKQTQSNFLLALQYVGGSMQQLMENKPSIIMTGRWDSSGKLEAALIKKINDHVSLRLTSAFLAGSDLNYSQMHLDCDIDGEDYTHTIKYGSGLIAASHMQTIGKNLVLGYEMMNLIERKMTMINYAFRYQYKKHKFFGQYTVMNDSICLAYLLNLKKRAHLISEFNYMPSEGDTSQVLGFQQRFATVEVIATINTKGKISTILNMFGSTYALKLCAIADYKKDSYKFGYGLSMGQPQQ